MSGLSGPDGDTRRRDIKPLGEPASHQPEFVYTAVLSPSGSSALKIGMPKGWRVDPNPSSQSAAYFSPDEKRTILVFTLDREVDSGVLEQSLESVKRHGAVIISYESGRDFILGVADRQYLKLHARTSQVEAFEYSGFIPASDCDFWIKICHVSEGAPVSHEHQSLVRAIWDELELINGSPRKNPSPPSMN